MDLTGRSALVTGGAGGLGAATVRHLLGLGLGVAVFDRDAPRAKQLADELGDRAVAVDGDVNDDEAVAAAIAAAQSARPSPWSSTSPAAASAVVAPCRARVNRTRRRRSPSRWR